MKTQAKKCKLTIARAAALASGNAALVVCLALTTVGLCRSATAGESTIITFDAPGAGTSAGQGTFAFSINQPGTIAGYYLDKSNVYHGFVRAPDGRSDDEGWVLSVVYDATTEMSDLYILDASSFTKAPDAIVHLPARVPYGFHGSWIPAERYR